MAAIQDQNWGFLCQNLGSLYQNFSWLSSVVDEADLKAICDMHGLPTDSCVREIVRHYGDCKETSRWRVNLVDPIWLRNWEIDGFPDPPDDTPPGFFKAHENAFGELQGLAIPLKEKNNHWTVIYVNIEEWGAIYFNSLRGWDSSDARKLMEKFFLTFKAYFRRSRNQYVAGHFRWEEDTLCTRQDDRHSFGIYAVRNLLDLLEHRRPGSVKLSHDELRKFRENGRDLLCRKANRIVKNYPIFQ